MIIQPLAPFKYGFQRKADGSKRPLGFAQLESSPMPNASEYAEENRLPAQYAIPFSLVGLIAMDMDSTAITIECIDEIADFSGVKAAVSAVTEATMRGELDFQDSLKQRVACLQGLSTKVLEEIGRAHV